MAVVGYTRVSSAEQVEGVSLEAQRENIEAYCKTYGLELAEVLTDAGISAKDTDHRPAAKKIIRLINKRQIDGVVIYKLDRLARNTKDAIEIAQLCKARNVALHCIAEKIDTDSPIGFFFFTLMAALAQMEREQIAERTKHALDHKRRNGEKTGGSVPFGYDVAAAGSNGDEVRRLVSNGRAQRTIALIKRLRQDGTSLRGIAHELQRRGIRTKRGNARWHPQVLKAILSRAGRQATSEV